jgi:hypothetical protein
MDISVSPKDEMWFLRVCHHISNAVYREEARPGATSFTTKSTWISMVLNGDLGGKNSATNARSCGMFTFDPESKIFWYLQEQA